MRTIYKYPLTVMDDQVLNLPAGAVFRHFGAQDHQLFIWCEIDPEQREVETRRFRLAGTGHPIPYMMTFLGSTMDHPFVWHLYEDKLPPA